jgi:hypothetical protein
MYSRLVLQSADSTPVASQATNTLTITSLIYLFICAVKSESTSAESIKKAKRASAVTTLEKDLRIIVDFEM